MNSSANVLHARQRCSGTGLDAAVRARLVGPGKPVLVRDIRVDSPIRWSQFGDARSRLWTIDGTLLSNFHLFAGIKSGEHVFLQIKGRAERKGEGLLFNAQMSELEVQELIVDATRLGCGPCHCQQPTPSEIRRMVLAEIQGGTLSYALFYAPAKHYFGRDRASVEQIFQGLSAP
jgi:hypothetical protein